MNDISDHTMKVLERVETLIRNSNDHLCQVRHESRSQRYLELKADPESYARHLNNLKAWREAHPDYQRLWRQSYPGKLNPDRKSYIATWKAAHPERQREYNRRWRLKQGIRVGTRKWLPHDESLRKMREIPQPFSAKQFALHTGITHRGACNLFKALTAAGKIQVVRKQRWARLYEICSSVPADSPAEMVAGGAP